MARVYRYLIWYSCLFAPVIAAGQSIIVGSRSPQGKISFQTVEDFQINQSRRIKVLPEPKTAVDPGAVKRLQKTELNHAGTIRNDGNGHLVRLTTAGAQRDLVLPENFTLKATTAVGDVPGRLTLTLVHSKRAKQTTSLAPELFFVYLKGASPDGAVLDFVSQDWVFKNLEEQLAAMQGFVASFANSPGVDRFRTILERKLGAGIAAFEDGAPYKDLLLLRHFSELGRSAYSQDASLQGLHDRIVSRIDFIEAKLKLLRTVGILGNWDALLDQYQDFERFQWSFPDVMALHQEALEESARTHSRRAQAFAQREDHETAAKEAQIAQVKDPANKEIGKLLEIEKILASQVESKRSAAIRKNLTRDSPEDRRFQRALFNADRSIQDKEYSKAEESIREAEHENPDAPEILLARARLLSSGDKLSEALPLLDRFDRMVVEAAEREKGETVRNQVLYELQKRKDAYKRDIEALRKAGRYSALDELLRAALKIDATDPDFLYHSGVVAGAMRDGKRAEELLTAYLARSNSLIGDPKQRDRASRFRAAANESKLTVTGEGTTNWLSGLKFPAGIYYCPESLAFQIPIDSVVGDKVRMSFSWDKGRLSSITTKFEDSKGYATYRTLFSPGTPEAVVPINLPDVGNFFFHYPTAPGALLTVRPVAPGTATERGEFRLHVLREKGRLRSVDDDNQTEIVLPSNPSVDLNILNRLEGPLATTVAGNSFFNPFLWDGLHYFTMQYDSLGRAESAQEWDADNLVRFSWDGQRLTAIRAYKKGTDKPYYQRNVTYSGSSITSEEFTFGGRSGHIRYIYSNAKVLQQIKIENEGKDWIARPRL